jgi:hypothetical protein
VQYNPYEVFETKHLGTSSFSPFSRYVPKKPSEPILYDPSKVAAASGTSSSTSGGIKEKHVAPPGSLLKVWDGTLEMAKDNLLRC